MCACALDRIMFLQKMELALASRELLTICVFLLSTLISKVSALSCYSDSQCLFSGYSCCTGTIWCCPSGYICTGSSTCLSYGVIIGPIVGGIVLIAIIVGCCICCRRNRQPAMVVRGNPGQGNIVVQQTQPGYVPPQGYTGQPQGYGGQPQGYAGQPQGYTGQPQGYAGQPQGYTGQPQGYN